MKTSNELAQIRLQIYETIRKTSKYYSRSFHPLFPTIFKEILDGVVIDILGRRYIDFNSSRGMLLLGGNNPRLIKKYREMVEGSGFNNLPKAYHRDYVDLCEELFKIAPIRGDKRVIFLDSRSEAIEVAIRIARWYSGKKMILGFTNSYHGLTLAAQSISTDTPIKWRRFDPAPGFIQIPYPTCSVCRLKKSIGKCDLDCLNMLENFKDMGVLENVSSIIMSPLRNDGFTPPEKHILKIRDICRENDVLLILDESRSSPARVGRWFMIDYYGIDVDCVVISNQLSSGHPLGVCITREPLLNLEPDYIEPDIGGDIIAVKLALETLSIIKDEGLVERAERVGRIIEERLRDLSRELKIVNTVEGKGMYYTIHFAGVKNIKNFTKSFVYECFKMGLLLDIVRPGVVAITPPITIGEEILRKGLDILEAKLLEFDKLLERQPT
ncbi:MAG: aminotransferase class III-fold pyridoxal phosphate-dependent enzyme [Nitrososphaerota archaeon]